MSEGRTALQITEHRLGEGSYGEVYVAQLFTGGGMVKVALKKFKPEKQGKIHRELAAYQQAQRNGPSLHVVQLLDYGDFYLVTELCHCDLISHMEEGGELGEHVAKRLF